MFIICAKPGPFNTVGEILELSAVDILPASLAETHLPCNGDAVRITDYMELFDMIGYEFGHFAIIKIYPFRWLREFLMLPVSYTVENPVGPMPGYFLLPDLRSRTSMPSYAERN